MTTLSDERRKPSQVYFSNGLLFFTTNSFPFLVHHALYLSICEHLRIYCLKKTIAHHLLLSILPCRFLPHAITPLSLQQKKELISLLYLPKGVENLEKHE